MNYNQVMTTGFFAKNQKEEVEKSVMVGRFIQAQKETKDVIGNLKHQLVLATNKLEEVKSRIDLESSSVNEEVSAAQNVVNNHVAGSIYAHLANLSAATNLTLSKKEKDEKNAKELEQIATGIKALEVQIKAAEEYFNANFKPAETTEG